MRRPCRLALHQNPRTPLGQRPRNANLLRHAVRWQVGANGGQPDFGNRVVPAVSVALDQLGEHVASLASNDEAIADVLEAHNLD